MQCNAIDVQYKMHDYMLTLSFEMTLQFSVNPLSQFFFWLSFVFVVIVFECARWCSFMAFDFVLFEIHMHQSWTIRRPGPTYQHKPSHHHLVSTDFIFLLLARTHFFLFFVLSFYHRFIQRIDKNTSTIPSEFKNRSMLLIADYYYWFAPFGRLWNMWSMLVCAVCYECSASLNSAPLVTHAHWYQFASLFLFEIRLFSLFRCVIVWL